MTDTKATRGADAAGPGQAPSKRAARDRRSRAKHYRQMLASERDASALYHSLAEAETGERREVFLELAAIEDKHARHWEDRLRDLGQKIPPPSGVSGRIKLVGWLARRFSADAVLPFIERAERADAGKYDADPDAGAGMAADERSHAARLAAIRIDRADGRRMGPHSVLPIGRRPNAREQISRREGWHRSDTSGALRAGVFGVSDGLVSNAALVMGFAGSGSSRAAIVLAGTAGLLAGAFSMAAGEYVSMASQREMYEREIAAEAQELDESPEEERAEMVLLYRAKGIDRDLAQKLADELMLDRQSALDTLVREELGLNPDELGSPWKAAGTSLLTFSAGAFVVLLPYLFAAGTAALVAALIAVTVALFGVGAGINALNGRPAWRGGLRQLIAGGLALGITFLVGHLLGTSVS